MSLAQEFITEYMWPSAFPVNTYSTGADHDSLGRKFFEEGRQTSLMLNVQTVTGAVVVTPKVQVNTGSGYETRDTLPSFTPVNNTYYFFVFDWDKYDPQLDPSEGVFNLIRLRLTFAGGTSIILDGTWITEALKRFPIPQWHIDGWNAMANDPAGNPRVVRVHEAL